MKNTIVGPLSKVWHTAEESLAGGSRKFDIDENFKMERWPSG